MTEFKEPSAYKAEGYKETYTGIAFVFAAPTVEMVEIEDIAHALSMVCRYTGHCQRFYSVAEHSAILTRWARDNIPQTIDKKDLLTVLLHDAAEAYIADVARPVKAILSQYRELESRIERVIAEKFGTIYPFPDWIKDIDTRILVDERAQLMRPTKNTWGIDGIQPLNVTITGVTPKIAKGEFLALFNSLTK